MERLTAQSAVNGTPVPNLDTVGDLCMMMSFCDEFDFCEGCPVKKMIDRLSEYEDTGLTPEEIIKLKEEKSTAKVRRCEDGREHTTARVTHRGVLIRGDYYYSDKLLLEYLGERVNIVIHKNLNIAEVFWRGYHIEAFALLDAQTIKCGATKEVIAKAIKYAKDVTSRTHQCQ